MNDDLTGIFDDLQPDDFFIETSAIDEREGKFSTSEAFNLHMDEQIRNIRVTYASAYGQMNPIAVLTNATIQRTFVPQADENLGIFLERLKREARLLGAHWFFLAKRHAIRIYDYDEGDEVVDIADPKSKEIAMQSGAVEEPVILWYAERRSADESQHRQGVLHLSSGQDRIVSSTDGDERQTFTVFSAVLDAVTTR